jgi:DNA (cytosine-5)-methyltransferase 1
LGFQDTRGTLFFDVSRILKEKKPKAFILENVKGLVNHDKGKTLKVILETLKELGYSYQYKVLNSSDYGIPQSRERWYCVGFRNGLNISAEDFRFPEKLTHTINLSDIITQNTNPKYKITPTSSLNLKKHLDLKKIQINDHTLAYEIRPSKCQFKTNGIAPTLTAKMGTGGNNVPVIVKQQRKLTEQECLELMGYPKHFKITLGYQAYKQIGNSIVVPVVELLAKQITKLIRLNKPKEETENSFNS